MNAKGNGVGYQNEYVLNRASVRSIWNQLTTSKGLSEWFAPNVLIDSKSIRVEWDELGDHREGTITDIENEKLIKWIWNDDKKSYLSMEIVKTELTSTVSLDRTHPKRDRAYHTYKLAGSRNFERQTLGVLHDV